MKFRDIGELKLGMRFYVFIDDDEYKIYTLVKNKSDSGIFMDEETFDLVEIEEEDLDENYILLDDYNQWLIVKFEFDRYENYKKITEETWRVNECINTFMDNSIFFNYAILCKLNIVMYKFMSKAVFYKLCNYILKYNSTLSSDQYDIDSIWAFYFEHELIANPTIPIFIHNQKEVLLSDAVIDEKKRLPDSVFFDAEDTIGINILSYTIYDLDDSVNIDNISIKFFIMYSKYEDKYFIILYNGEEKTIDDTNEYRSVFEFMSQNI